MTSSTIHGFPRIGPRRELKAAVEAYWAGSLPAEGLERASRELRRDVWSFLRRARLDQIPSNHFSLYDQVLDTVVLVGAVPERFRGGLTGTGASALDRYFAMARGRQGAAPMEMTKWFDVNYHYLVPELGPGTRFQLDASKPLSELAEARTLGITTRPVLLGPVTFLLLAKPAPGSPAGFDRLQLLDPLLEVYAELLDELEAAGAQWVQLDEPAFVQDRSPAELDALARACDRLGRAPHRPRLLVSSYFDHLGEALGLLAQAPVDGLGLDFTRGGARNLELLAAAGGLGDKALFAGIVDGRNVWANDLERSLGLLATLLGLAGEVVVSTSCSLQHVPLDLDAETRLDPEVRPWLAFARQKVTEVVTLAHGLGEGSAAIATELEASRRALAARRRSERTRNPAVRERVATIGEEELHRASPYDVRRKAQRARLDLPPLPTTTIGSFPQTTEVRRVRAAARRGETGQVEYEARMKDEIARVIRLQEELGLDVLVHGEPERNDMVQYFGERLEGYAWTDHGWVQSYGSRCVRPPVLYGDVWRARPMTVAWASYAQSLTARPVKGMLTGPVTMLAWSFVRDDQAEADTARQVALALRDEVGDLEAAGIAIVQVDEPALREKLPLRRERRAEYLDWAVRSFRLATAGVRDETQIHTHMCYSEFGDVLDAIAALDADVAYVEAARSRMELVRDLRGTGYPQEIGPGVYDIHSPRVPTVAEMRELVEAGLRVLEPSRAWVNPDCGLKTRTYAEVVPALRNMVEAAAAVRARLV
ncbi:MAG TPA: 5-methyltetrahydropteroyltriglutamate--homocysteine S-methyltransferase [Actinomycetota bacterium]|nr:5-methyltetrahydropteroyltriglutamate--homocysteine S-methyltransferase [Actinomycetota bacterium]